MCFSSKEQARAYQPWRTDPNVARFYAGDTTLPYHQQSYEGWQDALWRYEQWNARKAHEAQIGAQEAMLKQEAAFQKQQLAMQQTLNAAQVEAQAKLRAMQQEMASKQLAAQKEYNAMQKDFQNTQKLHAEEQLKMQKQMEAQRVQAEKDAALQERDAQRLLQSQTRRSAQANRFQQGRGDDRKNLNSASKGTQSLQVGIGGASGGGSGLQIPA